MTLRTIAVQAVATARWTAGEPLVFDHDADPPPGTHAPAGGVAPEVRP